MKRGEVWRVRLPFGPGHTQAGERPAILLQDDSFNLTLPTDLIIPFTTSQGATRFAGTLVPDKQNGLTVPSVALVFQLAALDKRDCLRPMGAIDQATLDKVFALLDQLTGR